MKMMGLYGFILMLSWCITYMIIFSIIAASITAVTSQSVFQFSNKSIIFLFFFLFGCAVWSWCYLLNAFFSRARLASTFSAILFFFIFFPYFTVRDPGVSYGSKGIFNLIWFDLIWFDWLDFDLIWFSLNSSLILKKLLLVYLHQFVLV